MVEDSLGRLWLSTHDDVFCFDGTRFFSLREFGFPSIITYGLTVDSNGAVLAAGDLGLYRFSHGRIERIVSGPQMFGVIAVTPKVLLATGSEATRYQSLPNPTAGTKFAESGRNCHRRRRV